VDVAPPTIVAAATPHGHGGIGVVRVSGSEAGSVARGLFGTLPPPRRAHLATFRDAGGEAIDRGLALYFPAPYSFTGEDVLELSAHGSPVVLAALVQRACELGARRARPGEFSERAFLNGKLDLAQAEAVADLIAAQSEAQARAAMRSLEGAFSGRVQALQDALSAIRVRIEAAIDFADEPVEAPELIQLGQRLDTVNRQADSLQAAAQRGVRLTDGAHVVIVGRPNVGKSSLMNALAGDDRAIVTDVPGTTRDVLRESIVIDGVGLTLADTAGLRESGDAIEGEGIRRAHAELARADAALVVVEQRIDDGDAALLETLPPGLARVVVVNKIDLDHAVPRRALHHGIAVVALSARTGEGVDLLRAELKRIAAGGATEGAFSARARHLTALRRASGHLEAAMTALAAKGTIELVAEELRMAQRALGEITGEQSSEELLGAIFSTFCIGK
jgi:tRNA modification GTPase